MERPIARSYHAIDQEKPLVTGFLLSFGIAGTKLEVGGTKMVA